jgi:hypothetical protein
VTNHIGLDELAIQEGIRKPWETLLMMTKTPYGLYAFTHKDLEQFAALVAAHEREACAKLCDDLIMSGPVCEVQQRYNKAYMDCRDKILSRGEQ